MCPNNVRSCTRVIIYINTHSNTFTLTGGCSPVRLEKQSALLVQVSKMIIIQLSTLCDVILSLISSILLTSDRELTRKRLDMPGLCGLGLSQAHKPLLLPHFCFHSLYHFKPFWGGVMLTPSGSPQCRISNGIESGLSEM